MIKKFYSFLVLCFWSVLVFAQSAPPTNLSGTQLRSWLKTNWYDGRHITLSYTTARQRLYNNIDNESSGPNANKLFCVYSGYSMTWNYGGTGTNPTPINCEHTIPQSFFNSATPMVSDIHHLYPTYSSWNSTRSNFPFDEISDAATAKWMKGTVDQTTAPTLADRPNWARFASSGGSRFQPRDVHKGNLARAVFYFFTMYPTQAGNISSVADINTLYQWHISDPVDATELARNTRVAQYQGTRNPYIDYPEIVARAWGIASCSGTPSTQASNVTFSSVGTTSLTVNFTAGNGDNRIVVARAGSAVSYTPTNGSAPTGVNSDFSTATDKGSGNKIVYSGAGTSTTVTNLTAGTTYHFKVYEYCSNGNNYATASAPVNSTITSTCSGTPTTQVTSLSTNTIAATTANISFTGGNGNSRLVVLRQGSAVSFTPTNGTAYTGNLDFSAATDQGSGNKVISAGGASSISVSGLTSGAVYHIKVYEYCSSGNSYLNTNAPVTNFTTLSSCSGTPTSAPTGLSVTNVTANSANLSFTAGNGDSRLVILRVASAVSFTPTNSTSYTADNDFSSSTDLGSGNKAVFSGANTSGIITGLSANTTYHIKVYEACGTNYFTSNALTGTLTTGGGNELFISEYVEGSSNNKAIEIYNGTGIDVSLTNYTIRIYSNGSNTVSNTITLGSDILADDDVLVVANSSASFAGTANISSASLNFNGDDAVALFNGSTMVDLIGQIGCDPGSAWTGTSSYSTLDKTLRRKLDVCTGISTNPSGSCAVGSFTTLNTQWDLNNIDDFSGLGAHTSSCGGAAISTGSLIASSYCVTPFSGTAVNVSYSASGAFNSGNVFTAQLSDSAGNFNSPVSIGTLSSTASSGTISATLPANTITASKYRVRVISDNPSVVGSNNGTNVTISTGPVNISTFTATAGDGGVTLNFVMPANCYDEILIVATAASATTVTPTGNGSLYTANTAFGNSTSDDNLAVNNHAVYKGSGNTVTVTSLNNGTTYYFKAFTRFGTVWSSGTTINSTPVSTSGTLYRSNATSFNWATAASWQVSTDGGGNWSTASNAPTASNSSGITIRTGHTVTAASAIVVDQLMIESGGKLIRSGDLDDNSMTVEDGSGDDVIIFGTYTYSPGSGTAGGLPIMNNSATIRVKTGGMVEVTTVTGGKGDAHANDETGGNLSGKIIWEDDAVFYWNLGSAFSGSGITFFPNTTTSPIFRTQGISNIGGGTATVINGKLRLDGAFSFAGNSNKTIRDGVTGSGSLSVASGTGKFLFTGTNAELSLTGSITNTNGVDIEEGAVVTLAGNQQFGTSTNITVKGTLDMGSYYIPSGYGTFTLNSTGTIRTSLAAGLKGASASLRGSGTHTFNGTVLYNGAAQSISAVDYAALQLTGSGLKTLPSGTINVSGGLTLSSSAELTTTAATTLNVAGDITVSGSAKFGGACYNNLSLVMNGGVNQNLNGNNNTIWLSNFTGSRADGILSLGSNTPMTILNDFIVDLSANLTSCRFNDGGNTIRIGDDFRVNRAGANNQANFTGTLILDGAALDANIDIDDNNGNLTEASINNLVINTVTGSGNVRLLDNSTSGTLSINGSLTIEAMASTKQFLNYNHPIDLYGSLTIEDTAYVNSIDLTMRNAGSASISGAGVKLKTLTISSSGALALSSNMIITQEMRSTGTGVVTTSNITVQLRSKVKITNTNFSGENMAIVVRGNADFDELTSAKSIEFYSSGYSLIADLNIQLAGNFTLNSGCTLEHDANELRLNGDLIIENGGIYSYTAGRFVFNGNTPQAINIPTGFELERITVNKTGTNTANKTLTINSNLTVLSDLILTSGYLATNNYELTLNNSATLTESNSSYVIGRVIRTANTVNNVANSFGNIGVSITTTGVSAGTTTIYRSTGTPVVAMGNRQSLKRVYDISTTTNTGLNATLVFSYVDDELNGINENNLVLFRSTDGGNTWTNMGGTVNTVTNTITLAGIDGFSDWTAGDSENPLPVDLSVFFGRVEGSSAILEWSTMAEKNNRGFSIEWSRDLKTWQSIGFKDGRGTAIGQFYYTFSYPEHRNGNWYRIKQVDYDGKVEYTKAIKLNETETAPTVEVIPNPVKNNTAMLRLNGITSNELITIYVSDFSGKQIAEKLVQASFASIYFQEMIKNLKQGVYQLSIKTTEKQYSSGFVVN